ncbi:hypothetical protein, partial [Phormidium sp. CCY1219]|uniref:hypothetical protein n=1 Tax=Phormidium sp. CCY1219 TaxID=2886104 RepID=UPI002D1F8703
FLSSLGVVVEKELFRLFQSWSGGGEKLFRLSVQFLSTDGVVVEKELFSCRYSFFPPMAWWWGKTIPLIGIVSFHRWRGGGEKTIVLSVQFFQPWSGGGEIEQVSFLMG